MKRRKEKKREKVGTNHCSNIKFEHDSPASDPSQPKALAQRTWLRHPDVQSTGRCVDDVEVHGVERRMEVASRKGWSEKRRGRTTMTTMIGWRWIQRRGDGG